MSMMQQPRQGVALVFAVFLPLVLLHGAAAQTPLPGRIITNATNSPFSTFLPTVIRHGSEANGPLPGQIIADPANPSWLYYNRDTNGDGKLDPYFLAGAGDPEGFLYLGAKSPDGTRTGGNQLAIINRLIDNKVDGKAANAIYMQVVRSHGGDGDRTQHPFTNSTGVKDSGGQLTLNQNILNQWKGWFDLIDANGITIYLFLYDDSARIWNTGNTVSGAERNFIRGIVNEFKGYKHLIWVVAEEYSEAFTSTRVANIAAEIRAADNHNHPIAVHKKHGLSFAEFAQNANIDQFAVQYNNVSTAGMHSGMVSAWTNAAGRYNLNMSESAGHYLPNNRSATRQNSWAAAMGGAYVMLYEIFVKPDPANLDDFIRDLARMRVFFESTEFDTMAPDASLAHGNTQYVLANRGSGYIAYSAAATSNLGIKDLAPGTYDFLWYDTETGAKTTNTQSVGAGDHTWPKPTGFGNEVALYLRRQSGAVFPGVEWETRSPSQVGLDASTIDLFAANVGGDGVIIKDGYLVKAWGNQSARADWASAGKPVISSLLFFAIDEGKLASVDAPIKEQGWALVSKDEPMTYRHLANMVGGYARGEAPGAAWAYNDYGAKLYCESLKRVFGSDGSPLSNLETALAPRLAALQFQDGAIFGSRQGCGVSTSPRDFARIGWWWLNHGHWNGTQLLPQGLFDDYVRPGVTGALPGSDQAGTDYLGIGTFGGSSDQLEAGPGIYGFSWWFNAPVGTGATRTWPDAPPDAFQANGHWRREVMTIIPSLNMVVAARGNWGSFVPGSSAAGMNQNLKLLAQAASSMAAASDAPARRDPSAVDPASPLTVHRYEGAAVDVHPFVHEPH
jgi:hypothetical protein